MVDSMIEVSAGTPPHRPTYNVRLSEDTLGAIVGQALPRYQLESCEQLESGKSFNNRIYFIGVKLKTADSLSASSAPLDNLVLKLSGHYFDARKVQNEVCSLSNLSRYCPTVPAPQVLAWSLDGQIIQTMDGRMIDLDSKQHEAFSEHSWILMTRLPGQILTATDLEGESGRTILRVVAKMMATWRSTMPDSTAIGNLRFQEPSNPSRVDARLDLAQQPQQTPSLSYDVGGLLLCHRYSLEPLLTPLSYYSYLVADQFFKLRQSPLLHSLNAKIGSEVQQLLEDLPRLSCFYLQSQGTSAIRFTHMDLSPRNILIENVKSQTSEVLAPRITGIIDWEFAAFLPYDDEFLNMQIRQPDDWTPDQYGYLMQQLAETGCEVPHMSGQWGGAVCHKESTGTCSCDSRMYECLCILMRVIDDIAPWFIQEGSHNSEELQREVDSAAHAVISGISQLAKFMT